MTPLILTRPHTHAGKPYAPGDRIEADANTADWLLAHDVATPDTTPDSRSARTGTESPPNARKEPKP
jgi:hypothetical protein